MTGRQLAHYEVLEKLGEGGMGVVYKARDSHLGRLVAIKVLPPEMVSNPGRKARFVQEAKTASALNHPNIVTIYDISSEGGHDFIVMEYVPGKTLDQLIPRKGMRWNEALKIAVQMADALACAHGAGIIHRDLKPANVIVTEKGQVKVLDFGLAKLVEHGSSDEDTTATVSVKTEEGAIVGTAAYMSPEQAEGKAVDARSDIFSFGAVLYEMVTGRPAFSGDSKMSTLAAIINQEPAPLGAEVPYDLARLIARCLRKDSERRTRHMEDARLALEDLKEESESGKLLGTAPAPRSRRRMLMWAGCGVAAIALAAAGAWFLRKRAPVPGAQYRPVPLTARAGEETEPSFSPDGNQVAYSWNGEKQDNFDIYVKLIGPGGALRLTTNPAPDRSPAWSPDGRWIAFLRISPGGRTAVMLIPALGGPERKTAEITTLAASLYLYSHLAWTRDGRALAVSHAGGAGETSGLFLVSTETGEKRRLTTGYALSPAFSPDGSRLAYVRQSGTSACDLYVMDVAADLTPKGEPRRLTFLNEAVGGPAWTADGREIVFSSGGHLSQRSLWRISASPGSARRPEPVGEDGTSLAVSRDGRRLVYARKVYDTDIWALKLRSRTEPGVRPHDSSLPLESTAIPPTLPTARRLRSTRIAPGPKKSGLRTRTARMPGN
ncbi:MAG: protein kinase [Bryobacteraceae bacterium]